MADHKFTPYGLTALPSNANDRDPNGVYFIRTSKGFHLVTIADTPNREPVPLDLSEYVKKNEVPKQDLQSVTGEGSETTKELILKGGAMNYKTLAGLTGLIKRSYTQNAFSNPNKKEAWGDIPNLASYFVYRKDLLKNAPPEITTNKQAGAPLDRGFFQKIALADRANRWVGLFYGGLYYPDDFYIGYQENKDDFPVWKKIALEDWVTSQNFLKSFTETDPTVPTHVKNISASDIDKWGNKQDKLSEGTNIKISPSNVISGDYKEGTKTLLQSGVNAVKRVWDAKTLHSYVEDQLIVTKLPSNYDLDTIRKPGNYFINKPNVVPPGFQPNEFDWMIYTMGYITDKPNSKDGDIWMFMGHGGSTDLFVRSADETDSQGNAKWTDWKELAYKSDINNAKYYDGTNINDLYDDSLFMFEKNQIHIFSGELGKYPPPINATYNDAKNGDWIKVRVVKHSSEEFSGIACYFGGLAKGDIADGDTLFCDFDAYYYDGSWYTKKYTPSLGNVKRNIRNVSFGNGFGQPTKKLLQSDYTLIVDASSTSVLPSENYLVELPKPYIAGQEYRVVFRLTNSTSKRPFNENVKSFFANVSAVIPYSMYTVQYDGSNWFLTGLDTP